MQTLCCLIDTVVPLSDCIDDKRPSPVHQDDTLRINESGTRIRRSVCELSSRRTGQNDSGVAGYPQLPQGGVLHILSDERDRKDLTSIHNRVKRPAAFLRCHYKVRPPSAGCTSSKSPPTCVRARQTARGTDKRSPISCAVFACERVF